MASTIKAQAGADLELKASSGKSVKITTDALGTIDVAVLATQGYVASQINNVINSAPGALDTLKELADALGQDANFSTTITNALAAKANSSDVYTKTAIDTLLGDKADTATTLAGYGIIDAYTQTEVDTALSAKDDATDVYTKTEIDTNLYTATEVDTEITNNNINFVNVGLATKQDKFVDEPMTSLGQDGDLAGMIAVGNGYFYRCVANYDGTSNIWARVALTLETW
jgi:hypothetical protein